MRSLWELIKDAESRHVAIGHFNFAESTVFNAAVMAAEELGVPVILGASEKEREFLGKDLLKNVILSISEGSRQDSSVLPQNDSERKVFFNADHTKSLEKAKEAVEMGYNSITFDCSDLSLEENIKKTKEVVDYAKSVRPNILVEGEIGNIASGSQLREEIPAGIELTSVEDAVRFVKETGVDLLAPAVGNIHGIIKAGEPRLNINRIKEIKTALRLVGCDVPLVLHGASGNSDEDIKMAIAAGVSIVHINTEVRLAWKNELDKSLREKPEELSPYKILAPAEEAAKEVIKKKLQLFNRLL